MINIYIWFYSHFGCKMLHIIVVVGTSIYRPKIPGTVVTGTGLSSIDEAPITPVSSAIKLSGLVNFTGLKVQ